MNLNKIKQLLRNSIAHHTLIYDAISYAIYKAGYGAMDISIMMPHKKVFLWLKKRYSKFIGTSDFSKFNNQEDMSENTVWTCWLQGEENAPYLVKCCFDSMRYHLKNKNIIILTAENFDEYCSIPNYIIDKWRNGIISHTHFSDILRSQVLIEHGGIWMDATTYITGNLPSYITRNNFFVFHEGILETETINMNNWFIYSKKQQLLLCETLNLLYEYYKEKNYLKSYYIFHIFFRIVTDAYPYEWKAVPYISRNDTHIFSYEMLQTYDKERFEDFKSISSIHKLTNKFDKSQIQENSYYSKLDELYKL